MEIHDVYEIVEDDYTLEINFSYYLEPITRDLPCSEQLDINKVHVVAKDDNDKSVKVDITSFFYEIAEDRYDEEIINYCKDN